MREEASNFCSPMILVFILIPFALNILYVLFTGLIKPASVKICSDGWISMFVILNLIFIAIGILAVFFMRKRDEVKKEVGYEFHATDSRFSSFGDIGKYVVGIFIIGFLASFFGYGGYVPMLIAFGKHPLVANATGMFILAINSLVVQLFFIGEGDFYYDYQLAIGAAVALGTLIGMYIQARFIVRLGRPSIIVFLLVGVHILSAALLIILEALVIDANRHNLLQFRGIC